MCCGQGEVRGAASGIADTFPEDLEMGTFILRPGLLPLPVCYGLDLKETAILHHPALLPLLSDVLVPQINRCAPTTENFTPFFSRPSNLVHTCSSPEELTTFGTLPTSNWTEKHSPDILGFHFVHT